MAEHQTVLVEVGHRRADIDVGMVDLVRVLWEAGIDTHSSCEGSSSTGEAFVIFPLEEARRFCTWLDAASVGAEPGSARRGLWGLLRGVRGEDGTQPWRWEVTFVDLRRAAMSWGNIGFRHDCDLVKFACPSEHVALITEVVGGFPFPGLRWWEHGEEGR